MSRIRVGCEDAARQLFLRYANRLRGLARSKCSPDLAGRFDEDDVVQSVFLTFFRGARQGSYDVRPGEDLWRLLLVIALHRIRAQAKHHRAAKRDVRHTQSLREQEVDSLEDVRCGKGQSLELLLADSLSRLSDVHRLVAELRVTGYGVSEIASQIDKSKRTTERILREIREALQHVLQTDSVA